MFSDDPPPSYDLDQSVPSPTYSVAIGSSEHLLQFELPSITGCPGCDWIVETKHMKINLGPRMWGLSAPSYGLDGCINGSLSFSGHFDRVERVTVTVGLNYSCDLPKCLNSVQLGGYKKIGLAHRGGHTVLPILCRTMELYNAAHPPSLQQDEDQFFSIPIPSEVELRGRMAPTPPSFFALYQNVSCEIYYELRFRMTRKGKGLRRSETQVLRSLIQHFSS